MRLTNRKTHFTERIPPLSIRSIRTDRHMSYTDRYGAGVLDNPRLKDSNINFRITWKILKQAIAYNPSSRRCNLCHVGIYFIIFKPHLATLNSVDTLANLC